MITEKQLHNIGLRQPKVSDKMMRRQYVMTVERVESTQEGHADKARISVFSFETSKGRRKIYSQKAKITDAGRIAQSVALKYRVPRQGVDVDETLVERVETSET